MSSSGRPARVGDPTRQDRAGGSAAAVRARAARDGDRAVPPGERAPARRGRERRNEARQLLANTNRQATQELREAEARGARLLEQSRHQATELTNSARAEVEQTLEWARAQANAIMARAQQGAEQFLSAAGLGDDAIAEVSEAIVAPRTPTCREPHRSTSLTDRLQRSRIPLRPHPSPLSPSRRRSPLSRRRRALRKTTRPTVSLPAPCRED